MKNRIKSSAGVAIVALVLLAGCGGDTPSVTTQASPRVVAVITQTQADCTLSAASDRIRSGLVAFTLVNDTGVAAAFDIWMIPEGHTYEEVVAHIQEERRLAESGRPGLGHPSFFADTDLAIHALIDQKKSTTASAVLKPGTYAVVCLRTFEQVGEIRPLAVVGPVVVEP